MRAGSAEKRPSQACQNPLRNETGARLDLSPLRCAIPWAPRLALSLVFTPATTNTTPNGLTSMSPPFLPSVSDKPLGLPRSWPLLDQTTSLWRGQSVNFSFFFLVGKGLFPRGGFSLPRRQIYCAPSLEPHLVLTLEGPRRI